MEIDIDNFIVEPGKQVNLHKDFDPGYKPKIEKEQALGLMTESMEKLSDYQEKLYAENTQSLLIIFQAMDAAGKDGTIKHVLSGLNPQGCQLFSFKAPNDEELDHDYLWRSTRCLPERGRMGIFNRSYYEEVLVVRVHPQILEGQRLPEAVKDTGIWKKRFNQIKDYEKYLVENGTQIVKFFLNVSKDEQKRRFLARIDQPEKNWKFSPNDVRERAFWDNYQEAYQDVFEQTSTESAPWYVIPADHKWVTHLAVSSVLRHTLKKMDPRFPELDEDGDWQRLFLERLCAPW